MQRILLIGFGFMGRKHLEVYRVLPDSVVVGIVDIRGELPDGPDGIPVFGDFSSALEKLDFMAVDICLPTDLHREIAIQAFAAGKHVFCEKPIALTRDDALAMTEAARASGLQFMVGHCIRFWPEYQELKRLVATCEHGRLLSLSLERRTGRPDYSAGDWVNQPERCLGAALDLHIHDTDFLLHLLGKPDAVSSQGIQDQTGWSSIATRYTYGSRLVTASGAWNYPSKWGFQMRFSAVFEHAALDYDSRSELTLTTKNEAPKKVPVPATDGYFNELAYFVACLEQGGTVTISTGDQATLSLGVVLTEIESAKCGKPLSFN